MLLTAMKVGKALGNPTRAATGNKRMSYKNERKSNRECHSTKTRVKTDLKNHSNHLKTAVQKSTFGIAATAILRYDELFLLHYGHPALR